MPDRGGRAWPLPLVLAVAPLLAVSTPAQAQRADENAVKAADDAFGVSVGRESIGLYSAGDVRGFSAVDAGNVRIDGLAFDPVFLPSQRLLRATTIRVGIAAQGFAFPAPTGVIDYALRRPGDVRKASAFLLADSYGALSAEFDAVVPLARTLSVATGFAALRNRYYNATHDGYLTGSVLATWRPTAKLTVVPLVSIGYSYDATSFSGPYYLPADEALPPPVPRNRFFGPDWLASGATYYNYGTIARWQVGRRTLLQAGVLRSGERDPVRFTNLYLDVTRSGAADQVILADPPAGNASTSGELRLSRSFDDGPRRHVVSLSLRGRARDRRYGGSDEVDLGPTAIGRRQTAPRPSFAFTPQDRDRIRQSTVGIAYEGRWKGVGEFSASVQKTGYTKTISTPGEPPIVTRATPVLYAAAAAAHLTGWLTIYGSTTRGLEDSGAAPSTAANRNQPLPAIGTSQEDAGVRVALTKVVRLVAGVFAVRKPYFEFDAANRYALLGTIRNRGIELSLSGAVTPRLDLVAGAVLSQPRVTGDAVRLGRVGGEPVDKPATRIVLSTDWRLPGVDGVSLDAGLTAVGRRAATGDDRVHVPPRAEVDLGGRYAFKLGGKAAQLRLSVANVGDVRGFNVAGSGVYDIIPGRTAQLSLAVDA